MVSPTTARFTVDWAEGESELVCCPTHGTVLDVAESGGLLCEYCGDIGCPDDLPRKAKCPYCYKYRESPILNHWTSWGLDGPMKCAERAGYGPWLGDAT